MGTRGLPTVLKESEGVLAHDLKTKRVQLDLYSMYFSYINAGCYRAETKQVEKQARAATISNPLTATADGDTSQGPADRAQKRNPKNKLPRHQNDQRLARMRWMLS